MVLRMALRTLTLADFPAVTGADGITLIDFWAPWCPPCRMFGPIFEKAAEAHPDLTFAKVNTDEEQELSATLGIASIPTLMIFRDGVLVFSQPGAIGAKDLERVIGLVEGLDMEAVKADAATA